MSNFDDCPDDIQPDYPTVRSVSDDTPRGLCDWKDTCSCCEELQKLIKHNNIPLDINDIQTTKGQSDYGVSEMFNRVDELLKPLGYELYQFDTGGDYYIFCIIPS